MNLEKVFTPTGLLSRHFPTYEFRPSQLKMANVVLQTIESKGIALIEGATGVGKSFGYLIPIIESGKKAIVATSNKNLQDQLSNKDLPALKIMYPDLEWTVLKGKNNYFCWEHFHANEDEIAKQLDPQVFRMLVEWSNETQDGDMDTFPEQLPDKVRLWVTCDQHTKHEKESKESKYCFADRARARAKSSNIVLVNHTLLAIDEALRIETEGKAKILPDMDVIVIDEAHAFSQYASLAFSDEISVYSLYHLLNWPMVRSLIKEHTRNAMIEEFKQALNKYLPQKDGYYYQQQEVRKFTGFEWLAEKLEHVKEDLKVVGESTNDEIAQVKGRRIRNEIDNLTKRLADLAVEDEDKVRWVECQDNRQGEPVVKLKSVPVSLADMLSKTLFTKTVVCCSATLQANNSFDYFRDELGVPERAVELVAESPFDYKNNAMIYFSDGQQDQMEEVKQLVLASQGRAFVLFTSYKDMESFYNWVDVPYPKLVQARGISKPQLLEEFKSTPNAVLFATKSFWEGVDIPGDQLSLVVVHKIPFGNPSDLLLKKKAERIDRMYGKGKSWGRMVLPEACLALKQGVGRLIRTTNDRGVMALLDARIMYKSYGKAILSSFPSEAKRTQKLENVKAFFGR